MVVVVVVVVIRRDLAWLGFFFRHQGEQRISDSIRIPSIEEDEKTTAGVGSGGVGKKRKGKESALSFRAVQCRPKIESRTFTMVRSFKEDHTVRQR